MSFDPTKQLTEKEIKEHVHNIVGYGGNFAYTNHARDRMEERGYSYRDIYKIIMHGSRVESIENAIAGNWKYTFNGEDLEGDSGSVVIAVLSIRECLVITVLST